jgi:hypothetical protein
MDIEDVHVEAVAVQKSPDESITIHKDRKNVITKLPRAEAGSHVPGKEIGRRSFFVLNSFSKQEEARRSM